MTSPKINGSAGAFIAVIVCLVAIIAASCIAIFYLLRDQRAFDTEQGRRRPRNHFGGTSDSQISSTYEFESTQRPSYWGDRLTAFFRRPTSRGNRHPQNRSRGIMASGGNHGWIQAGSIDEWQSDTGVEGVASPSTAVREVTSSAESSTPSLRTTNIRASPIPISRSTTDSTSSVRFDLRGLTPPERHLSPMPSIHSQLSLPSSYHIPLRTLSPEPIPSEPKADNDSREYLTPAGITMRTLSGGTKFVEGL